MSNDVVLLHGWASTPKVWQSLLPFLGQWTVHNIALPGYTLKDTAGWREPVAAITPLLPQRFHLVGWSLGGNVAMAIADQFPERVQSISTVCSVPNFVANEYWPWAMPSHDYTAFLNGVQAQTNASLKRFVSLQSMGDIAVREVNKALKGLHCEATPEVLLDSLHWLGSTDQLALWQRHKHKHFAIFAEHDALVPEEAAQHFEKAYVLADCGHAPMLSQPKQLAQLLEEYWR